MIVKFISSESGEVIMLSENARELLKIVGKETAAKGVFTLEEIPGAIEKLKLAIEVEQAAQDANAESDEGDEDNEDPKNKAKKGPRISLARRAFPLIEMLKRTAKAGKDNYVMWEAKGPF